MVIDELKSKKVKLEEIVARDKRIKNNNMFIRNEGTFYRQTKKLEKQKLEEYLASINLPTSGQEFGKMTAKHQSLSG